MKRLGLFLPVALVLAGCAGPPSISGASPPAATLSTTPYDIVALGASNTAGRGRGRTAEGVPPTKPIPHSSNACLHLRDATSAS